MCITREHFNSENKYRCEVCTGLTEAMRTVSYPVLPRLLIIQLKRFSGGMEKINTFIPTPFTMRCFCSRCCALPDGEKLHVYHLYSVITHVGATLSVGHYIAYTSALDAYGEFYACPKVKRKAAQQQMAAELQLAAGSSAATNVNAMALAGKPPTPGAVAAATQQSAGAVAPKGMPPVPQPVPSEKNTGIIKKMIFGRSKASSSGDVTKHMKNALNGLSGSSSSSNNSGTAGSSKHNHHNQALNNSNGMAAGSATGTNNSNRDGSGNAGASDAAKNAFLLANAPCTSLTCCGILTKPLPSASAQTTASVATSSVGSSSSPSSIGGAHAQNGHAAQNGGVLDGVNAPSNSSSLYSIYYTAQSGSTTAATAPTTTTMTANGRDAIAMDTGIMSGDAAGSLLNGSNHKSAAMVQPLPPADTTWYMCDDDKIKSMSQREFEELLSPNNKKNVITPYLLFYVRSSLKQP